MKFMPAVELPQIAVVGAMFAVSIASRRAAPSQIAVHFRSAARPIAMAASRRTIGRSDCRRGCICRRLFPAGTLSRLIHESRCRTYCSGFPLITLGAAYAVIYLSMRGIKVSLEMIIVPALAFNEFAFISFLACDFGIARVERVIVAPPFVTRKSKSGTIGPAPQLSKQ
jgi:hypothetical protein